MDTTSSRSMWLYGMLGLAALSYAASYAVAAAHGRSLASMLAMYSGVAALMIAMVGATILLVYLVRLMMSGEKAPASRLWRGVRTATPADIASRLVPILSFPVFQSAIGTLKVMLPTVQPYSMDEWLFWLDRAMFFGTDPWRVTHALFGGIWLTRGLDLAYALWVVLLMFVPVYFALTSRSADKARFFLSYMLAWTLIGTVAAYALASVGPCYFDRMGFGGNYNELMARLWTISAALGGTTEAPALATLNAQELLWDGYRSGELRVGAGISAMPSMHVSVATIYALCAARRSRALGRVMWFYVAVIWIGSVHLGWHYATDGVVSIAGTLLIWRAVDRLLSYSEARKPAFA